MKFAIVALSFVTFIGTAAAKGQLPGEAVARKLLVQTSPMKGVHLGKKLVALGDPVLARRYPKLRMFAAEHDTDFFEYPHVKSLAVVGPVGRRTAVVEMLFSEQGWSTLLGHFKGASADSAAGAIELVTALRDLLGPRVWPIDFKPAAPVSVPVLQGSRLEVVLAERVPRRAVLAVTFDSGFHVASVVIENRLIP